jgi:GTP-binding protein
MTPIPKIALVGRPNVGKSTLFNRIAGRRKAITDSRAGSTRDRNYAQTSWQGAAFELIDTGGLLLGTADPLLGPATAQAERAIDEADVVVFLVDARAGLLPDDRAIAAQLRKRGKNVLLAVNKAEEGVEGLEEFSALGFHPLLPISAEHGRGVGELLDAALAEVPRVELPDEESQPLRIALVGRPNVGKSSLLNRLLGEERAVVSPIPGTTRDAVDSLLVQGGKRYLFVDTAGIRRVRALKENVDHVSVLQARRSIERADVAVLVLDATEGVREMDATIGGYIQEARAGVVIVLNKWDRARELSLSQKEAELRVREQLKFLPWAPLLFASARTGSGLPALFKAAQRVQDSRYTRVTTGALNRELARATERHAPKAARGSRLLRLLYGTQVGVAPPTFVLSMNHADGLHFSYKRYLENRLRAAFGFEGTPLVLKVRARPH